MKASDLIRHLAYQIGEDGDMELSFVIIDKDWNETEISPKVYVEHGRNTIKLSLKPE